MLQRHFTFSDTNHFVFSLKITLRVSKKNTDSNTELIHEMNDLRRYCHELRLQQKDLEYKLAIYKKKVNTLSRQNYQRPFSKASVVYVYFTFLEYDFKKTTKKQYRIRFNIT